jgi:hypothetical protein
MSELPFLARLGWVVIKMINATFPFAIATFHLHLAIRILKLKACQIPIANSRNIRLERKCRDKPTAMVNYCL